MTDQSPFPRPARGGRFEQRVRLAPLAIFSLWLALALIVAIVLSSGTPLRDAWSVLVPAAFSAATPLAWWVGGRRFWLIGGWLLGLLTTAAYFTSNVQPVGFWIEILASGVRVATLIQALLPMVVVVRLLSPAKAALLATAGGLTLFALDVAALIWALTPPVVPPLAITWVGEFWQHDYDPTMELVHQRWGWASSYLPSNVRDYFEVIPPSDRIDQRCWRFSQPDGCELEVTRPAAIDAPLSVAFRNVVENQILRPAIEHRGFEFEKNSGYSLSIKARSSQPLEVNYEIEEFQKDAANGTRLTGGQFELTSEPREFTFEVPRATVGWRGCVRLVPQMPGPTLELLAVHLTPHRLFGGEEKPVRYNVSYQLNGEGCRDHTHPVTAPADTLRVAVLGDSYTLGIGVHAQDLVTSQLERRLNERLTGTGRRVEVMNFGNIGFCTRQQRACFRDRVAKYRPDVTIVLMVENDVFSMEEEQKLGFHNLWHQMQNSTGMMREVYRRRYNAILALKEQYEKCLPELVAINEMCQAQGGRFLPVIFRVHDWDNWARFSQTIQQGMQSAGIPVLDLHQALRAEHTFEQLTIHPVDDHPTEIAHGIAAAEIEKFLWDQSWLAPTSAGPGPAAQAAPLPAPASGPAGTSAVSSLAPQASR